MVWPCFWELFYYQTKNCPHLLPARFSPAQAELYEAVLEVQRSCLSLCSPGVSLDHIYNTMLALLGRQLRQLGIVKASTSDADVLKVIIREEWIPAGRSFLSFYEGKFCEKKWATPAHRLMQTRSILYFNIANVYLQPYCWISINHTRGRHDQIISVIMSVGHWI